MISVQKNKSIKTFVLVGAAIGAIAGLVVGALASENNIGSMVQPFAFFVVMLTVYGTILGSIAGYGITTHKAPPPIKKPKSNPATADRKTIVKDGWIIVDGERIRISPGSTIIVFE